MSGTDHTIPRLEITIGCVGSAVGFGFPAFGHSFDGFPLKAVTVFTFFV